MSWWTVLQPRRACWWWTTTQTCWSNYSAVCGCRASRARPPVTAPRPCAAPPRLGPDVIVLDINMPVLVGVSVVTALRAMDNEIPVCALSATSSVDDPIAGLEAAADDYLVKPFVPDSWRGSGRCCAWALRQSALTAASDVDR